MINLFEDRHVLAQLGQTIGTSRWIAVPQQRITDFGHITEDPDLMHIDPAWAAEHSPYGKTIAFGFLTVSLLTRMANDVIQRPGDEVSTLNYGFDRLRLLSPVMVGSRIRGHFVLKELELRSPTQYRANYAVTVEIDGQAQACAGGRLAVDHQCATRAASFGTGTGAVGALTMHAAGYTCPWVVARGQRVALHASLPLATHIDLVRIACANAERQTDGRPHGPPQRIVPVAGAVSGRHGPAVQPLQPGAQVHADCAALPTWADLTLVLAVQRLPRGRGGAVLSLLDAAGHGLQIDLQAVGAAQARLRIALTGSADALALPLPGSDWLLLTLAIDRQGLRLRSAICRATVPEGVPAAWREVALTLGAAPAGVPSAIHLGTRADATAADVRLDLVSVLPSATLETLSPRALLAGEHADWEQVEGPGHCLLRAHLGTGRSTQDLAGQATISEVQRPYTAVRGVRWDGAGTTRLQAPAHYSALHFNSDHAAGCPLGRRRCPGPCPPTCPAAPTPSACRRGVMPNPSTPASSSPRAAPAQRWPCCCPPSATWPIPTRWKTCAARWSRPRRMPPSSGWTACTRLTAARSTSATPTDRACSGWAAAGRCGACRPATGPGSSWPTAGCWTGWTARASPMT
jgi:acyl dehydratase